MFPDCIRFLLSKQQLTSDDGYMECAARCFQRSIVLLVLPVHIVHPTWKNVRRSPGVLYYRIRYYVVEKTVNVT